MVVVDSGRKTAAGKTIWVAAPAPSYSKTSFKSGSTTPQGSTSTSSINRVERLLKATGQSGQDKETIQAIANNPQAIAQLEEKSRSMSTGTPYVPTQPVSQPSPISTTVFTDTAAVRAEKEDFAKQYAADTFAKIEEANKNVKSDSSGTISGDNSNVIPVSTITEVPKEKGIGGLSQYIATKGSEFETASQRAQYGTGTLDPIKAQLYGLGTIALGAASVPVEMADMVRHPVKAVIGQYEMIRHPIKTIEGIGQALTTSPGQTIGKVIGMALTGKAIGGTTNLIKNVYVKVGSKYVPPETVFAKSVLSGKETLPTTSSIPESLQRFNKPTPLYDVELLKSMLNKPEAYTKPITTKTPTIASEVLSDIKSANPEVTPVLTGGTARNVVTGVGRIRDIDIVTNTGKAMAEKTAAKYPAKYEVVTHPTYPEIYRLKDLKTGKVVADFGPYKVAEEGLINPKTDIKTVGEYKVVSPEVMLKSKATQILKEKATTTKQAENIQQLTGKTTIKGEKVIVSSAGPSKYPGGTDIIVGKKAGSLIEDPGLYVTPKGEASPYFLRVSQTPTGYSLNPIKALANVKGVPTVTEISIKKVSQYPREVIELPGFEYLKTYQEASAGKGVAYISKRSEIGQGNIPRQTITDLGTGKSLGIEKGTSEIEAVIGYGEKIKYNPQTFMGKVKGFEKYTTYEGRNIAIREADLVTTKPTTTNKIIEASSKYNKYVDDIKNKEQVISTEKLLFEQEYYNRPQYKTPYPSIAIVSTLADISSYPTSKTSPISKIYSPTSKTSPISKIYSPTSKVSEVPSYKPTATSSKISYPKEEIPTYKPYTREETPSYKPTGESYTRGGSSEIPPYKPTGSSYGKGGGSSYIPPPSTPKTPPGYRKRDYEFVNTLKGLMKVKTKSFGIVGNVADYRIYARRTWGYLGGSKVLKTAHLTRPKYYTKYGPDVGNLQRRLKN